MYRIVAILLSCFLSLSTIQAKQKLAVMPLQPKGVEKRVTDILDTLLVTEIDNLGQYQVIGHQDINAILGLEKVKEALGCSDLSCAAEIGGSLGADFMVSGIIGRLGSKIMINLQYFDIKNLRVIKRVTKRVKNDEDLLAGAIEKAVAKIFNLPAPVEQSIPAEKQTEPQLQTVSQPVVTSEQEKPIDTKLTTVPKQQPSIMTQKSVIPVKATRNKTMFTLSLVSAGLSVASLAAGTIFGLQAKDSEEAGQSFDIIGAQIEADRAKTKALLANISFIAGGVFAATAIPLFIFSKNKKPATASITPVVGIDHVGLSATVIY